MYIFDILPKILSGATGTMQGSNINNVSVDELIPLVNSSYDVYGHILLSHFYNVILANKEIIDEAELRLKSKELASKILGFNNKLPIVTPEDLKGLNLFALVHDESGNSIQMSPEDLAEKIATAILMNKIRITMGIEVEDSSNAEDPKNKLLNLLIKSAKERVAQHKHMVKATSQSTKQNEREYISKDIMKQIMQNAQVKYEQPYGSVVKAMQGAAKRVAGSISQGARKQITEDEQKAKLLKKFLNLLGIKETDQKKVGGLVGTNILARTHIDAPHTRYDGWPLAVFRIYLEILEEQYQPLFNRMQNDKISEKEIQEMLVEVNEMLIGREYSFINLLSNNPVKSLTDDKIRDKLRSVVESHIKESGSLLALAVKEQRLGGRKLLPVGGAISSQATPHGATVPTAGIFKPPQPAEYHKPAPAGRKMPPPPPPKPTERKMPPAARPPVPQRPGSMTKPGGGAIKPPPPPKRKEGAPAQVGKKQSPPPSPKAAPQEQKPGKLKVKWPPSPKQPKKG